MAMVEYWALEAWWTLRGYRKPTSEEVSFVAENVTIMFKSFERQKQARALVKSIWKYYPGVRIVIADDSSKPLEIIGLAGDERKDTGDNKITIIQMPFNSGLRHAVD